MSFWSTSKESKVIMYGSDEGVYSCVYWSKEVLFWNTRVYFPIGYNAECMLGNSCVHQSYIIYICNLFEVILWLYNCSEQCVWLHAVQFIMVVDSYIHSHMCTFWPNLLGHTTEPASIHVLELHIMEGPLPCPVFGDMLEKRIGSNVCSYCRHCKKWRPQVLSCIQPTYICPCPSRAVVFSFFFTAGYETSILV